MDKKQELEDIFTIFHDGIIEGFKIESDTIHLKICTEYLAELIDEAKTVFKQYAEQFSVFRRLLNASRRFK